MPRHRILGDLWALPLILAAFAPVSSAAEKERPSAYDPTAFTTSYWCGPPAKFNTLERYQEVKEAGFNVAMPPCGAMTVEQNKRLLAHCEELGLKAIIADSRMVLSIGGKAEAKANLDAIVADYAESPALLGYFITDEPAASAFAGLAEVVAYLKEKDPRHPGYINLFPNYATAEQLGAKTYDEYVRAFAETVKPFVISWDHYHFTNHGDRPGYLENLRTVRQVALETGIPFWQIVLSVQHFDYRNETEPELRYDAMQTLAFGGRGLLWFTYWTPGGGADSDQWRHAMINPDGSRDPHYEMIQGINADARAIGDALGQADSTLVYQVGPDAKLPRPEESPILTSDGRQTVGVFSARDNGKTLALVTNRDIEDPLRTQAEFQARGAKVEVFDPAQRAWSPAKLEENGSLSLEIPAGGGVLLRW